MRVLIAFLIYSVVELSIAVLIASLSSWLVVFALLVAGFILGLLIMRDAGGSAAAALRQASATNDLPPGQVGDSALRFGAGLLVAIPGFLTDILGLMLLIPPMRRLMRRGGAVVIGGFLRRNGMSMVTTTVQGTTVTKVVPGDVVVGGVIRREDVSDDQPGPGGADDHTRKSIDPDTP